MRGLRGLRRAEHGGGLTMFEVPVLTDPPGGVHRGVPAPSRLRPSGAGASGAGLPCAGLSGAAPAGGGLPGSGAAVAAATPGGVSGWTVRVADDAEILAYRRLRREVFVREQGLFDADDADRLDEDPRTVVLVAVRDTGAAGAGSDGAAAGLGGPGGPGSAGPGDSQGSGGSAGEVLGGVRLGPAVEGRDIGWWTGSRLVVAPAARRAGGIGPALVRAACTEALRRGVLRFEATVQKSNAALFRRLGWERWAPASDPADGDLKISGMPHVRMRWPITRAADLLAATKTPLGGLLPAFAADHPHGLGGTGFLGDDAAPVPGSDVVAACDAILPALVTKDPEWAGWCSVLVNLNDLSAMGAEPLGLLDAVAAPSRSHLHRILNGLRSAAQAWGVPVLGGHTQHGVAASLSVTALGRAARPIPSGGGRPGQALSLTADISGGWRPGFGTQQWDSSSARSGEELRRMAGLPGAAQPAAAKDVSMAGIIGTAAMLAEASGTGAVIDVERVPVPSQAAMGDWLTCFPGYAMLTADAPGASRMGAEPQLTASAECGELTAAPGVSLRWPDGVQTPAAGAEATGLGSAGTHSTGTHSASTPSAATTSAGAAEAGPAAPGPAARTDH